MTPAPGWAPLERRMTVDASCQLVRVEGLGDVIVGAEVEALGLVGGRPLGGQQDDGDGPTLTELAHDLDAVEVRRDDVEEHDVGPDLLSLDERFSPPFAVTTRKPSSERAMETSFVMRGSSSATRTRGWVLTSHLRIRVCARLANASRASAAPPWPPGDGRRTTSAACFVTARVPRLDVHIHLRDSHVDVLLAGRSGARSGSAKYLHPHQQGEDEEDSHDHGEAVAATVGLDDDGLVVRAIGHVCALPSFPGQGLVAEARDHSERMVVRLRSRPWQPDIAKTISCA